MRVTFWGVRGSCPTPGPTTLRYGGNTSCVEVRLGDGTVIVLDGGSGLRGLGARLDAEGHHGPIHLLVSHPHLDHVIGVPFFAPFYRSDATVVLHPFADETADDMGAYREIFDGRRFPLRVEDLPARLERPLPSEGPWQIGSATVRRIPLNHPGGSVGYRIDDADGASMALLTDHELDPPGQPQISAEALARFASGCGLVIHDAQYLEEERAERRGRGHSTVPQVLALGRLAGAHRLALYHHDPDRDDGQLDRIGAAARGWWDEQVRAGEVLVATEGSSVEIEPA